MTTARGECWVPKFPQSANLGRLSATGYLMCALVAAAPIAAMAQEQPDRAVGKIEPLIVDDDEPTCIAQANPFAAKPKQPYSICGKDMLFVIYSAGSSIVHVSIEGERKRLNVGAKASFDNGCSLFFLSRDKDTYLMRIDCG